MRTVPLIRPIVIAHRGACGYLPEHTFAAKALAYSMGADYLEQDVVATADDELVVLHDIHLDRVTNVANVFSGRHRLDGRYYVRDFTLAELRRLSVNERINADGTLVYPDRFSMQGESFEIHTLSEELEFIASLRQSLGRDVGVYPEIKRPAWHRDEGIDIGPRFLDALKAAGYTDRNHRVFVQCFDAAELERLRGPLGCDLKLVQLIGENEWGESPTDFDQLRTRAGMIKLSRTVDGIGPHVSQLYRPATEHAPRRDKGLVSLAHEYGLEVHPYTFRIDDYPAEFVSFDAFVRFCRTELNIDGLFTDFPDRVLRQLAVE